MVGGVASFNEVGVFIIRFDILGFAEPATAKYSVEIEGVKISPVVRWGYGIACTGVQHIVQLHIDNAGWGDGVYFS